MNAEPTAQPSVLVVDDNAIVALSLVADLEHWGYQVAGAARTHREALELAQRFLPALALMDIELSDDEDGVAVAQDLQSRFGTSIVYLTGHRDEATRKRAAATKPVDILFKPYTPGGLRSVIERALSSG